MRRSASNKLDNGAGVYEEIGFSRGEHLGEGEYEERWFYRDEHLGGGGGGGVKGSVRRSPFLGKDTGESGKDEVLRSASRMEEIGRSWQGKVGDVVNRSAS